MFKFGLFSLISFVNASMTATSNYLQLSFETAAFLEREGELNNILLQYRNRRTINAINPHVTKDHLELFLLLLLISTSFSWIIGIFFLDFSLS